MPKNPVIKRYNPYVLVVERLWLTGRHFCFARWEDTWGCRRKVDPIAHSLVTWRNKMSQRWCGVCLSMWGCRGMSWGKGDGRERFRKQGITKIPKYIVVSLGGFVICCVTLPSQCPPDLSENRNHTWFLLLAFCSWICVPIQWNDTFGIQKIETFGLSLNTKW